MCPLCLFSFITAAAQAPADSLSVDTLRHTRLDEVTVIGKNAYERVSKTTLGTETIEMTSLRALPSFMGENDLIKSLSLLPGVRSEGDGIGGFEVRGGSSTQNNIRLDGITLYNPSHLMGIFSTFNDDALAQATLYKGPIPAQYGEGSASVLETMLAPGDMTAYHGSFSVGLLMAKIKAEGHIVKDKLSLALSVRRSYVDAIINIVPEYRGTVMNFYDITAKMRYVPKYGQTLDLSFFMGKDNLAIKNTMGMYWGNIGTSINWTARAADSFTFKTTASYTDFSPVMDMTLAQSDDHLKEYIRTASVNERVSYAFDDDRTLEFGLRSELLAVKSAERVSNNIVQRDIRSCWGNSLWISYDASFADRFGLNLGLRLSAFTAIGGNRMNEFLAASEPAPVFRAKTYFTPEPRLCVKYNLSEYHNVKLGASITSQNLHSIRSSATSFPFDRFALTSVSVKPERCTQYVVGYTGMTPSGAFDWSIEGYWKQMDHVYDYMDGRGMYSRINLESIILGGKGRSRGIEFMLRKNTGRLTGWISYTLSRTQTKIEGINSGSWYNSTNDRRNDFNVTAIYKLSDRWSLSGAWIYSSGHPLTAPDAKYELNGQTHYYYSQRNGYMTPATHRLDLSATYTHQGKRFTYRWDFGIFNAYGRLNPYIVYFKDDPESPSGTRAVIQALFAFLPSLSYTLKF